MTLLPGARGAAASQTNVAREMGNAERILRAELRDGCRDRVVIGGLARYAAGLARRLAGTGDAEARAASVVELLAAYASESPAERTRLVREALAALAENSPRGPDPRAIPPPRTDSIAEPTPQATATAASASARDTAPPPPARGAAPPRVGALPPPPGVGLDSAITDLKGVGPQRARLYTRLGLRTVRDLLFHVPVRHIPYPPPCRASDLLFQAEGSVEGVVERLVVEDLPRGLKKLRAVIRDETGAVEAVWLRHGIPRLGIKPGDRLALSGRIIQVGRQVVLDNPDFERADGPAVHTRGLVPVYPLTAGLVDREVRARVHWAITHFADAVPDPLPEVVRAQHRLMAVADALRELHFPTSAAQHEQARQRFAFEEVLAIQLIVLQRRMEWQASGAPALPRHDAALDAVVSSLPFALTDAQRRVVDEILDDLARAQPMTRLLQGEVGAGKTVVAALALLNAAAHGYQGALMAPTEILAEQHYAALARLLEAAAERLESALGRQPRVRLLTGSTRARDRAAIYAGARDGSLDLLVGTQALIQESVEIARLGVVVVDEQHRFGVKQRDALRARLKRADHTPHLLVMTATPIPRTLALSTHGDLDISVLDGMPPGRQPVRTVLLPERQAAAAYERVKRVVARGRQGFVICPLVDESEVLQAKAATEEFERLRREDLAGLRLALLHGRMRPAEKDAVMRAFRDHETDVLVSTSVVEVGVDVPNATVMVILGAERFGLAQLHQFRGRVGRGAHASDCILVASLDDPRQNDRLRVIEETSSGLVLAEHDLRLRGPGEVLGVRQSGLPDQRFARLDDLALVRAARAAAVELLRHDPDLARPEHAALHDHVAAYAARVGEPN